MKILLQLTCICCLVLITMISAGCTGSGNGPKEDCIPDPTYNPVINPAGFASVIDNPLWQIVSGTRYVYHGGEETIEVTVTEDTRQILGITAIVVHDVVSEDGKVTEDTYDWYAQDTTGNVWYLGEDTKEYENGKVVSTKGSWEAGVDGAKPGIVMHAVQRTIGSPYRQKYYACEAEDMASVPMHRSC